MDLLSSLNRIGLLEPLTEFYTYLPKIKIYFFHFELTLDLEPDIFSAKPDLDTRKFFGILIPAKRVKNYIQSFIFRNYYLNLDLRMTAKLSLLNY